MAQATKPGCRRGRLSVRGERGAIGMRPAANGLRLQDPSSLPPPGVNGGGGQMMADGLATGHSWDPAKGAKQSSGHCAMLSLQFPRGCGARTIPRSTFAETPHSWAGAIDGISIEDGRSAQRVFFKRRSVANPRFRHRREKTATGFALAAAGGHLYLGQLRLGLVASTHDHGSEKTRAILARVPAKCGLGAAAQIMHQGPRRLAGIDTRALPRRLHARGPPKGKKSLPGTARGHRKKFVMGHGLDQTGDAAGALH